MSSLVPSGTPGLVIPAKIRDLQEKYQNDHRQFFLSSFREIITCKIVPETDRLVRNSGVLQMLNNHLGRGKKQTFRPRDTAFSSSLG